MKRSQDILLPRPGFVQSLVVADAHQLMYVLRTTSAAIAALCTAMWLQLEVPRWAIWTAIIVSPPVRGDARRKTVARIIGTTVGCAVAVAFAGLFPQSPLGFNAAFAAWLGFCAYWGTLQRGFVSYGATLAAFTSAIVVSDVFTSPHDVFDAAINRGTATLLGVLFAWLASEIAAKDDDVPASLAQRVSTLVSRVLEWAADQLGRTLDPAHAARPESAPLTGEICAVDGWTRNALAESPALRRVKVWLVGLPTALLSVQSSVLCMGSKGAMTEEGRRTVRQIRNAMLDIGVALAQWSGTLDASPRPRVDELTRLRERLELIDVGHAARAGDPPAAPESAFVAAAARDLISALSYVLASFQAMFELREPDKPAVTRFPAPKFPTDRRRAIINSWRALLGITLAYGIWDLTQWSQGSLFWVNVAIALVLFLTLDDPVAGNRANLWGTLIGGAAGLAAKHLLLIRSDRPLDLLLVMFPFIAIGVYMETTPRLAAWGVFLMNAFLILVEPSNPQRYDFASDVNTLVAIVGAYALVSVIFTAIGTPKRGRGRALELLEELRRVRRSLQDGETFTWERWQTCQSRAFDVIRRLQAETAEQRHGLVAIRSLVWLRRRYHSIGCAPSDPAAERDRGGVA